MFHKRCTFLHYIKVNLCISFVGENIIGAPKRQSNFWYPIKIHICTKAIAILRSTLLLPICSYCSFNFPTVSILYIDSWFLFCIAIRLVIAFLTIARSIVAAPFLFKAKAIEKKNVSLSPLKALKITSDIGIVGRVITIEWK